MTDRPLRRLTDVLDRTPFSTAAAVALALSLLALVSLLGAVPLPLGPAGALALCGAGLAAAVYAARSSGDDDARFWSGVILTTSLVVTLTAAVVVLALLPCGRDCL